MQIKLDLAKLEQIDGIFAMYKKAVESMKRLGIDQWDDAYPDLATITEDVQNQHLHVGILEGVIAVAVAVNQSADPEYQKGGWQDSSGDFSVIHRLCVSPDFQNRGIARAVMTSIEHRERELGRKSIRLDSFSKNPHALRLYQSLGYRIVGEAQFRKGTFIMMEKLLT
ncbi:MAG: GNAT family N-acetyltransferase [Candidatus Pararuminococcus gallinarum]